MFHFCCYFLPLPITGRKTPTFFFFFLKNLLPYRSTLSTTWFRAICGLHIVLVCFVFCYFLPLPIFSFHFWVSGYMWVARCFYVFCCCYFLPLPIFAFHPMVSGYMWVARFLFLFKFSSPTNLLCLHSGQNPQARAVSGR